MKPTPGAAQVVERLWGSGDRTKGIIVLVQVAGAHRGDSTAPNRGFLFFTTEQRAQTCSSSRLSLQICSKLFLSALNMQNAGLLAAEVTGCQRGSPRDWDNKQLDNGHDTVVYDAQVRLCSLSADSEQYTKSQWLPC